MHTGTASVFASACCGLLLGVSSARAQPADQPTVAEDGPRRREPLVLATDGTTPPTFRDEHRYHYPHHRRGHDGASFGAAFGRAWLEGVEPGWYGRLDFGAYTITTRRRGTIFGVLMALEGWGAPAADEGEDGGGGLPMLFYGGIQSDALFLVLGGGFHLFLVDSIDDDAGVGLFAPQGMANLGFDLEGVRFLVDARAGYRWQLGADDRAAVMLGGTIQLTTD